MPHYPYSTNVYPATDLQHGSGGPRQHGYHDVHEEVVHALPAQVTRHYQLGQWRQPEFGIRLEHSWSVGDQACDEQSNVVVGLAISEFLVERRHPGQHLSWLVALRDCALCFDCAK